MFLYPLLNKKSFPVINGAIYETHIPIFRSQTLEIAWAFFRLIKRFFTNLKGTAKWFFNE